MKNLAQFKAKIKAQFDAGKTINVSRESVTTFAPIHPSFIRYPNGEKVESARFDGCKIGRVQSNSFTRVINDGPNAGKESWSDFGKASEWSFPNDSTAVWSESYSSSDHSFKIAITYTFN